MNASTLDTSARNPHFTSPFVAGMGLQFGAYGYGWGEVSLELKQEFINGIGFVAGGVYAALADFAMVAAMRTQLPPSQAMMTMDLSLQYLHATRNGPLRGVGRVIDLGRRVAHAEADIFFEQQLLVKANGIFMLLEDKRDNDGESA
jgi:uncharacterized protein (TIGR00369 family)